MTVRILAPAPGLAPGKTDRQILERVLEWLRDPGEISTLILHAPGATFADRDGEEYVIDGHGNPVSMGRGQRMKVDSPC